jgi:DNA-binding response OmpR family regulator
LARSILIVAEEVDLRARIARALMLSGYNVELAADRKRALKLASAQKVAAAIIVPGSSLAGLAMARELRDTVPKLPMRADRYKRRCR